ncbi:alkaline phosphatase family protein [Halobacterium sp. KA-4]|uniref:alkaline phosphatase family protein n=1 Tax=Halobacterium sp. KA-4 TaxID=2896367 RepID=UPI001E352B97|nr:alkaline phosphatase family protein [Halobacterium sp. KA-4]MCD2200486.1 alkaline phosphatase family protein [Halobacterium sp. KA-4]
MTLVVLGIDALDPELVDSDVHSNLTLGAYKSIETIVSVAGEPSTHELWPTIITGLPPSEHGLQLDDGVAWENPLLRAGSRAADHLLPKEIQSRIGAWLLTNTSEDAFREHATYYEEHDLSTVFDGRKAKAIGVPNYVVNPDDEDREHLLRQRMGDLFERDSDATGGHTSADPVEFYEQCMEMGMVRIARTRRALRSRQYELVFGYTSALDLIGHVSYDDPGLQRDAYNEMDDFVGELVGDLNSEDDLLLVSDHGLQGGLHTEEAIVAATNSEIIEGIKSVTDIHAAVEETLDRDDYTPSARERPERSHESGEAVREQLEDLGYM